MFVFVPDENALLSLKCFKYLLLTLAVRTFSYLANSY